VRKFIGLRGAFKQLSQSLLSTECSVYVYVKRRSFS